MGFIRLGPNRNSLFNLFDRRVVSDANIHHTLDRGTGGDIFDRGIDELHIGDRHQMAIQRPGLGRTKTDLFDHAVVTREFDAITYLEGLIKDDGH